MSSQAPRSPGPHLNRPFPQGPEFPNEKGAPKATAQPLPLRGLGDPPQRRGRVERAEAYRLSAFADLRLLQQHLDLAHGQLQVIEFQHAAGTEKGRGARSEEHHTTTGVQKAHRAGKTGENHA